MQNEHTLNWLMDLVANAKSENTDEAKKNVVSSVPTSLVESLMHDAASSESSKELEVIGTGIAASLVRQPELYVFQANPFLTLLIKAKRQFLSAMKLAPQMKWG